MPRDGTVAARAAAIPGIRAISIRMESPTARIVAIVDGRARVAVTASACPRCAAGKGCGAGLLARQDVPREIELELDDRLRLEVGDTVRLSLEPSKLLRAAVIAYGLPLAGVVTLPAAAWFLAGPLTEAAAVSAAGVGLVAGVLAARRSLRRDGCLRQFVPSIVARVPASGGGRHAG